MKKNDVFTFTAPNGVEVTAVAIYCTDKSHWWYECKKGKQYTNYPWVCYAQNRLCIIRVYEELNMHTKEVLKVKYTCTEVLVDYCIIPEYDELLARYYDIEVAQAETQSEM